jgi:hypothetical protein
MYGAAVDAAGNNGKRSAGNRCTAAANRRLMYIYRERERTIDGNHRFVPKENEISNPTATAAENNPKQFPYNIDWCWWHNWAPIFDQCQSRGLN